MSASAASSPRSKKTKHFEPREFKRQSEDPITPSKRIKSESNEEDESKKLQSLRRKNFIIACERVSHKACYDLRRRFQLLYVPSCLNESEPVCKHQSYNNDVVALQIPGYAEEAFNIEFKSNVWFEALEVCQLCIKPDQYLSAGVLQNIVEIMLNAHEDSFDDQEVSVLLDECQLTLAQNFTAHPPCISKNLRKCYIKFLTSPMSLKDNTFTNRVEYGYDKGLVKYCFNRLEYELSAESVDGPFFNKEEHTPADMKQTVKGLHWQKEKFEIYELLPRQERIKRLIAVLDSVLELLQFDLALWHSRHTTNQGSHIMRSHRPLMAFILWSDNILYTGAVNNNCRQILTIFTQFVHLGYPQDDIDVMTNWLNALVQTFYICETNSNSDFPNTGKYCAKFAKDCYQIISVLPHASIIKVLESITPTYMTSLIAAHHLRYILDTKEEDILKIILQFINNGEWKNFNKSDTQLEVKPIKKIRQVKDKLAYLLKQVQLVDDSSETQFSYNKYIPNDVLCKTFDQNHVIHTLFIALDSYLDAYNVTNIQTELESLNEQLEAKGTIDNSEEISIKGYYTVTEHYIKKLRTIFQLLQELVQKLLTMKSEDRFPEELRVLKHIRLLGI